MLQQVQHMAWEQAAVVCVKALFQKAKVLQILQFFIFLCFTNSNLSKDT